MTLVARKAPDFTVSAVLSNGSIIDDFNFYNHIHNKYAVLFFWPMDFTFVCPSEIIAFNNRVEEFQKLGVQVVGISIDSVFVHNAWRNTSIENGGIGEVNFPIVADLKHEVVKAYGVEHPDAGVALRASFFIDKTGIVRHETINDLSIGRNMDEMIRIIDAFQFHEQHGEVCPAQWTKGKKGIKGSPDGVADYLKNHSKDL